MTNEEQVILENILAHQLEDVMFHFDMIKNYALLEDYRNMEWIHNNKFMKANKCHEKFTVYIIHQYKKILNPSELNRVIIFEEEQLPSTKNNETTLANQILNTTFNNEEDEDLNNDEYKYNLIQAPSATADKKEMHKHLLQVWEKWEEESVEFYEQALEIFPKHCLLEKLLKMAKCDLKAIKYCINKL